LSEEGKEDTERRFHRLEQEMRLIQHLLERMGAPKLSLAEKRALRNKDK
jgi:hypothetical protein